MQSSSAGLLRVIVTRPEHDARYWVEQLRQSGFDAQALPLIEIAALPDSFTLLDVADFDAFMFVSGNAVEHFMKAKPEPPVGNASQRFMAPGPGTAKALRACGIPDVQIDVPPANAAQFDSESLWQLVGSRNWHGCRVLIVRGANSQDATASGTSEGAGRDWFAQKLRDAGAGVEFLSVYERRTPVLGVVQDELARQAATDSSVWIFSSSEAVLNLTGPKGISGQDWGRARAIATHPRIAETARQAGWGVVVESRPALADIVATLRSIELGYS
ncbi:MAG: uroporphyrinogen-III synthase [Pseudomonadota bacterium]